MTIYDVLVNELIAFAYADKILKSPYCSQIFPKVTKPSIADAQEWVKTHSISSLDELAQKVQEFTDKILLNQQGSLTCFFLDKPGCEVEVTLNAGYTLKLNEVYVFVKKLPGEATSSKPGAGDYQISRAGQEVRFSFSHQIVLPVVREEEMDEEDKIEEEEDEARHYMSFPIKDIEPLIDNDLTNFKAEKLKFEERIESILQKRLKFLGEEAVNYYYRNKNCTIL